MNRYKDLRISRGLGLTEVFLERRGEVEAAFALGAVEDRRGFEHPPFDAVEDLHTRHGRLPDLKDGVELPLSAARAEISISHSWHRCG
jgi:hypothetical protein